MVGEALSARKENHDCFTKQWNVYLNHYFLTIFSLKEKKKDLMKRIEEH